VTSLLDHVIGPPAFLLLVALRMVPLLRYSIQMLDSFLVRVSGASASEPIFKLNLVRRHA